MSAFVPAVNRRIDQIKFSGTFNVGTVVYQIFHHSGHCRQKLQSGTRSSCLLCGLVKEGTGKIQGKPGVVICIHLIAEPVIVISRIGYAGHYFTGIYIRNHSRRRAWLQCKLCGLNLQVGDFIDHKIIGIKLPGCKPGIGFVLF